MARWVVEGSVDGVCWGAASREFRFRLFARFIAWIFADNYLRTRVTRRRAAEEGDDVDARLRSDG